MAEKPSKLIHTQHMAIDEAREVIRQYRYIVFITVTVIATGSTFYHLVEGWRWLDAIYFSVISLATVGYGDFTPQTDAGKIFTMFYLVIGIGIFAALLNTLLKSRFAKRSLRLQQLEQHDEKE